MIDLEKVMSDEHGKTWRELDGTWKHWEYNPKLNRYTFDDIAYKTLLDIWNGKAEMEIRGL